MSYEHPRANDPVYRLRNGKIGGYCTLRDYIEGISPNDFTISEEDKTLRVVAPTEQRMQDSEPVVISIKGFEQGKENPFSIEIPDKIKTIIIHL